MIYSEHLFEHISYPEGAEALLRESLRILETRGVFSVGVPDTELALKSYFQESQFGYFKWYFGYLEFPHLFKTRMEALNYLFHQSGEHQFLYDFETLKLLLEHQGFVNVNRRPFDPMLDSPHRAFETLYVTASKPGSST